jgi:hypothetical protein
MIIGLLPENCPVRVTQHQPVFYRNRPLWQSINSAGVLNLGDTEVTDAGTTDLQKALPGLTILR